MLVEMECPSCGAMLRMNTTVNRGYCSFCGNNFVLNNNITPELPNIKLDDPSEKYNILHDTRIRTIVVNKEDARTDSDGTAFNYYDISTEEVALSFAFLSYLSFVFSKEYITSLSGYNSTDESRYFDKKVTPDIFHKKYETYSTIITRIKNNPVFSIITDRVVNRIENGFNDISINNYANQTFDTLYIKITGIGIELEQYPYKEYYLRFEKYYFKDFNIGSLTSMDMMAMLAACLAEEIIMQTMINGEIDWDLSGKCG